jgi:chemosensory pili system protein ChpA (sensor histidine kinase/response regulator)
MRLHHDTGFTPLAWVKPELDEILRLARRSLEDYFENQEDDSAMRYCASHLHQVQGSLRMLELRGAAAVAGEMERLAEALVAGAVENREEAFTVLMRGIVQLPDYLERIQAGFRDVPQVLLPLINELREVRAQPPWQESALFTPDLRRPLPAHTQTFDPDVSDAIRQERFIGLLGRFRRSLADARVRTDVAGTLSDLVAASAAAGELVSEEGWRRLFWVTEGLAQALDQGILEGSEPLLDALDAVTESLAGIVDRGAAALAHEPPQELTQQLLYFVAHAPIGHGALDEIRRTFDLDAYLPEQREIEHARGSMGGHNKALMTTVTSAIKEDLLRVKDALDLHMRNLDAPAQSLADHVTALAGIADTLNMLDLAAPRRVVLEQRAALEAMVGGSRPIDESGLLDVAGALLYVESSLDDQVVQLGSGDDGMAAQEAGEPPPLPASEARQVLETLVREALTNFAKARQCFVAFVEAGWDWARLSDVPHLLAEVSGALRILQIETAPGYIDAIATLTREQLIERQRLPKANELDSLADALSSLEYYLEALSERRGGRDGILQTARNSLEQLGISVDSLSDARPSAPAPTVVPAVVAEARADSRLPVETAAQAGPARAEAEPSTDAETPTEPEAPESQQWESASDLAPIGESQPIGAESADSTAGDAAETGLAASDDALAAAGETSATPALDAGAGAGPKSGDTGGFETVNEDIDDEIREIFLEEVEEEIQSLDSQLETWRQTPEDMAQLRPIRRIFHTLKGSGRLVGATTLGEFSWHIESALNRVLDGKRAASPAVVSLIDSARGQLRALQGMLAGQTIDLQAVLALQHVADRVADGEEVFDQSGVAPPDSIPELEPSIDAQPEPVAEADAPVDSADSEPSEQPEAEPESEPGIEIDIDPVLQEILVAEVSGHLETLRGWRDSAIPDSQPANDALLRAVHTINGAFAMAEVPLVTELTVPLEGYVRRLLATGEPAAEPALALYSEVLAALEKTNRQLEQAKPRIPGYGDLPARMEAIRDSLPEAALPLAGVFGHGFEDEEDWQDASIDWDATEAESAPDGSEPSALAPPHAAEPVAEPDRHPLADALDEGDLAPVGVDDSPSTDADLKAAEPAPNGELDQDAAPDSLEVQIPEPAVDAGDAVEAVEILDASEREALSAELAADALLAELDHRISGSSLTDTSEVDGLDESGLGLPTVGALDQDASAAHPVARDESAAVTVADDAFEPESDTEEPGASEPAAEESIRSVVDEAADAETTPEALAAVTDTDTDLESGSGLAASSQASPFQPVVDSDESGESAQAPSDDLIDADSMRAFDEMVEAFAAESDESEQTDERVLTDVSGPDAEATEPPADIEAQIDQWSAEQSAAEFELELSLDSTADPGAADDTPWLELTDEIYQTLDSAQPSDAGEPATAEDVDSAPSIYTAEELAELEALFAAEAAETLGSSDGEAESVGPEISAEVGSEPAVEEADEPMLLGEAPADDSGSPDAVGQAPERDSEALEPTDQPVPDAGIESEAVETPAEESADAQIRSDAVEPSPESSDEAAVELEAEPWTEPEAEAEAEGVTEAEGEVEAEPEAEPEVQSEAESEAESESEAIAEAQPAEADDGQPTPIQDPDVESDEPLDVSDLDLDLLDIFVEESRDLLDSADSLVARLRDAPTEREPIIGLQRDLHTLKGGARMAGVFAIGDLSHVMESLLEAVAEGRRDLSRDGVRLLEAGLDRLHGMSDRVANRQALSMPTHLVARFDAMVRGEAAPAARGEAAPDGAPELAKPGSPPPLAPLSQPMDPEDLPAEDEGVGIKAPQEQVRIRADLLDRLVNYAGEVAIYRSRLEQQVSGFRGNLNEFEQTNTRLRDQLRKLDMETEAQIMARYQREPESADAAFDPLEMDRFSTLQQLSRALAESSADLTSLQNTLEDLTRQYETLLQQQSRVSTDLQEGLMRTRMVPFESLVPRLRRVLRQAGGELGKQVQLKVEGAQGEMDRSVLERMTAPLEHMLRNAVAHGLETPDQRAAAGKPEEGTVSLAVRREGSEVVIVVADDGRGLDADAIRRKAIERGRLAADAEVSRNELYAFILETGFSTAREVSRLAGRGVGMDVVHSEIRQLGGSLHIDSEFGAGSRFTIRLPFSMAVTQAVFVRIGETIHAVPIASVRGVGRISRDALNEQLADGDAVYQYAGETFPIHDLGVLLNQAQVRASESLQIPLLLIRSGDLRAAVLVDQVVGNREIVVKPVGPQIGSIPGVFGATIMGDGSVVIILDVAPLVRRTISQAEAGRVALAPVEVQKRVVPLVMVVDDSITMRKVTGRVLERNNFEVIAAKDGIDAIEKMAERVPDLMLLDVEMPRMDGYELAIHMRADSRLRNVPIIMITSRTGEKHRQRALEVGVNDYLGKPYQESELIKRVTELLHQAGGNV